jgi:hypothetical protein
MPSRVDKRAVAAGPGVGGVRFAVRARDDTRVLRKRGADGATGERDASHPATALSRDVSSISFSPEAARSARSWSAY